MAAGDLPFFLALMEHLAARGLTCPQPVKNRNGDTLGTLVRPARRRSSPSSTACGCAGRTPAIAPRSARRWRSMHLAGADFHGQRAQRALGRRLAAAVRAGGGARRQRAARPARRRSRRELGQLEKSWPRDLPQGVIHADLFPDNVFFLGDRLSGLIDFYFACTDTLAYDVAICLNAWCFEPDHSYNVTKGRACCRATCKTRPLSEAERGRCRCWRAARRMRFLLTRLVDWLDVPPGALVRPKDPLEYFRKLRFHQTVAERARLRPAGRRTRA